jgi:hypothetical protein
MLSSRMEVLIHNILTDYDVPFEEEYEFDDLVASSGRNLRFDFAIFRDDGELDFLIEAQGRQHYQAVGKFGGARGVSKQQYNDQKKIEYCNQHHIKLIIIPYWEENQITYDYIMHKAGY